MARTASPRTRIAVPDTTNPPPLEPGATFEPEDPDEPEREADPMEDIGDIALLADSSFTGWTWSVNRQRSQEEIAAIGPTAKRTVFITRITGPFDIMDFQKRHGGGVFEFMGYFDIGDGRGKRLRKRIVHEIEGPLIQHSRNLTTPVLVAPAAAPSVPAPAPLPDGSPVLERVLTLLERQQQQITALSTAERGKGEREGLSFGDMLEIMDRIKAPATAPVGDLIGLIKQGIELRGSVEGGSEKSTTAILVETLAPALERIATTMITQAPRPLRRPAPRPAGAPPSEATVIEPGQPEPEAMDMAQTRMMAAVDALNRAIADSRDPGDFADTLTDLLAPDQLALLRNSTDDQVITVLTNLAGGQYPLLSTDGARTFIAAVLAELREPSGE